MSLSREGQSDFGAGSQLEVAPHLISPTGFNKCENGLLNDDGSIYKRGGSLLFTSALGAIGTRGKFVWEGEMSPGRRTIVGSGTEWKVAAEDSRGTALVALGGSGVPNVPPTAVFFQHLLWISGGIIYGGSRKAADYATGTITKTAGSATLTGSGTSWTTGVDPGMILQFSGERAYVVKEVVSNTSIVLYEPYEGATAAGASYSLKRLGTATAAPYKAGTYLVAGERLVVLSAERRIDFSEPNKPHLFKATIFPQETVVENFHELAEGVKILGGSTLGVDKLLVYHTQGITTFSNMAKSIVDGLGNSQHREDVYSRDVVLWGNGAGIAASRSTMLVPAIDNVYLIDGTSAPTPVADAILPRYRELILEGNTPGGAFVARSHLFLPIVDSGGIPIETLVCRLDKPYSYRDKTLYPWTFVTGAGAEMAYGTVRHPKVAGEVPRCLVATKDGNLVDTLPFFFPEESNAKDHDSSVPRFSLLTRDYGIGNEAITRWRRLQLFYQLFPTANGEESVISAEVGTGITEEGLPLWDGVEWDEFEWAAADDGEFSLLEGGAPTNAGIAGARAQNEYVWLTNTRARYVRYRLVSTDPVAKLSISGVLIFPAEPGGVRHSRVT